jgi:hypothetical protein
VTRTETDKTDHQGHRMIISGEKLNRDDKALVSDTRL